jgi:hypothetical protein
MDTRIVSHRDTARFIYSRARAEAADVSGYVTVIELGEAALDFMSGDGPACDLMDRALLGVGRLHQAFGGTADGLLPTDAGALFSLVRLSAGPAVRRIRDRGKTTMILTSTLAASVLAAVRGAGYAADGESSVDRIAFHAFAAEILTARPGALRELGIDRRAASLVSTAGVVIDALADMLAQGDIRFGTARAPENARFGRLAG